MKKWILRLMLLSIVVSGCSKEKADKKEDAVEVSSTAYVYPLLGVQSKEKSDTRPIAVMYNNHPAARPQSGLSNADLVYEVLAEGDVTRFLAIFQSSFPETFGPVRSARDYYIELAQGYRSLYVCHGHSPEALALLEAGAVDSLDGMNYDGTLFQRDSTRRAPHNSYLKYEKLVEGASMNGYSLQAFTEALPFDTETMAAKQTEQNATQVEIKYSTSNTVRYIYDNAKGSYTRYNRDEVLTDRENDNEITTKNIFVVYARHVIQDDYGRRDVDLVSGGDGMLIKNGAMQSVTWKNVNGRILPFDGEKEVTFAPGKTWIQIVPTEGVSVSVLP
ncbi:MAG: DUF3048 domain-containing protein [Bacilli bacterium]